MKATEPRTGLWVETLGCCDFKIKFWPGRQYFKPEGFSHHLDLAAIKEDILIFLDNCLHSSTSPQRNSQRYLFLRSYSDWVGGWSGVGDSKFS